MILSIYTIDWIPYIKWENTSNSSPSKINGLKSELILLKPLLGFGTGSSEMGLQ
jgi:hypothetical protein